jgi:hypothetical protein
VGRTSSLEEAATHLGWTLNVGYGAAVLILGLLSTTAWAKATVHGAAGTSPGDVVAGLAPVRVSVRGLP